MKQTGFFPFAAVAAALLATTAFADDLRIGLRTETSSIDEFVITVTLDFDTGVPTLIQLDLIGIDSQGTGASAALAGDLVLRVELTDLNAAISIEAPPLG